VVEHFDYAFETYTQNFGIFTISIKMGRIPTAEAYKLALLQRMRFESSLA
jgi:hypothetical protein